MLNGTMELDLSEFTFVYGASGRMLRCTLGMVFVDDASGQRLGIATKGCIVMRSKKTGELIFGTPMTTTSRAGHRMRLTLLTPALHKTLIQLINESRYAQHIGELLPDWAKAEIAKSVDKDLPDALTMTVAAELTPEEEMEAVGLE